MRVAAAPRVTNTVEKPRMKTMLVITTWRTRWRGGSPSRSWATLIPLMKERYPGTIGRTQGDTNEARPARNAVRRGMVSVTDHTTSAWMVFGNGHVDVDVDVHVRSSVSPCLRGCP